MYQISELYASDYQIELIFPLQLFYELHTEGISPSSLEKHMKSPHIIGTLVNKAADSLLHIIDTCVKIHGEAKVLYL